MQCPNCDREIRLNDGQFCPYCASPLNFPVKTKKKNGESHAPVRTGLEKNAQFGWSLWNDSLEPKKKKNEFSHDVPRPKRITPRTVSIGAVAVAILFGIDYSTKISNPSYDTNSSLGLTALIIIAVAYIAVFLLDSIHL